MDRIETSNVALDFNPIGGSIADLVLRFDGGRTEIRPLHRAPWVNSDEDLPETISLVERQLSGDFFCAPFGNNADAPIHGWTANGRWIRKNTDPEQYQCVVARYDLDRRVNGAVVSKEFRLFPDHPFVYQRHRFEGGTGHLPVAHHAMIHVPGGARLSFSKRQFATTPAEPLESDPARGRSALAYPQDPTGLHRLRGVGGEVFDASVYPFHKDHEDIVVLAGDRQASTAWSAALAVKDGFLFFAIKDAKRLPETLLWMSNGGRDYAPWNGRHAAVLGIEEAATSAHENGRFESSEQISSHGLATGLLLEHGRTTDICYGFGAVPAPTDWQSVESIVIGKSTLTLVEARGDEITLPFHGAHFGL